jgi:hypothetical protein
MVVNGTRSAPRPASTAKEKSPAERGSSRRHRVQRFSVLPEVPLWPGAVELPEVPQSLAMLEPLLALRLAAPLVVSLDARLPGPQSVACPLRLEVPVIVPGAPPLLVVELVPLSVARVPALEPLLFCASAAPPKVRARIEAVVRTRRFIGFPP